MKPRYKPPFAKLREALEKNVPLAELKRKPRYDHRSGQWVVENEGGTLRYFDTQVEADTYYDQ